VAPNLLMAFTVKAAGKSSRDVVEKFGAYYLKSGPYLPATSLLNTLTWKGPHRPIGLFEPEWGNYFWAAS